MPHIGYTTKPQVDGTASLAHYGKHYYLSTRLVLKGRGIVFIKTMVSADLVPQAQRRVGEHEYKVTLTAFDKLCETYTFVSENLL